MSLRTMGRWLLSRVGCDCPLCGARVAGARLCAGCEADICEAPPRCPRCALWLRPDAPHCAACLGAPRAFSRTLAAFDYAPPADTLILMLKTRLRLSMAPVLARLIAAAVVRGGPLPDGALLVAIPASRASLRLRGMNPAGEIARSLAAELGLPLARGVLRRRRETPRQTAQGRHARRRGAQDLFYCVGDLRGRPLLLVDDVMTTGSTANAAAAALLAAGAAEVTVLVAARTP
ncbi:ComF family protein [Achromobacter xylosoxidans]|uniref:ComF family protein n=1 Tax=Alcaligenes xylosoxydans xylosoxydans TaxID=85698 RepID=UPI00359C2B95